MWAQLCKGEAVVTAVHDVSTLSPWAFLLYCELKSCPNLKIVHGEGKGRLVLPVESIWSDSFCVFLPGNERVSGRLCKSFLALAELVIMSGVDLDFPFLVLPATDAVQCGRMIIMLFCIECTQLQLFVGTNEIVF